MTPARRTTAAGEGLERFGDRDYLRRVLMRLHAKGGDAWRADPEANELMLFAIERFAKLAKKHGLEADDGGSAAFEAMRNPSVVFADDPWAVVVHAVNTTLAAREFADQTLCSVETARRGGLSGCWVERFCDRDTPIWEHHRAFVVTGDSGDGLAEDAGPSIMEQAEAIAWLLNGHGWPLETATVATEIILFGLADAGSRPAAYERLRREKGPCVMTNLAPATWTALLRLLLGDPADRAGISNRGKGILLRLALGEPVDGLARDPELVRRVRLAAPGLKRRAA